MPGGARAWDDTYRACATIRYPRVNYRRQAVHAALASVVHVMDADLGLIYCAAAAAFARIDDWQRA
jgi:hypothetical protein